MVRISYLGVRTSVLVWHKPLETIHSMTIVRTHPCLTPYFLTHKRTRLVPYPPNPPQSCWFGTEPVQRRGRLYHIRLSLVWDRYGDTATPATFALTWYGALRTPPHKAATCQKRANSATSPDKHVATVLQLHHTSRFLPGELLHHVLEASRQSWCARCCPSTYLALHLQAHLIGGKAKQ